jgi:hypothetical protein
MRSTSFFCSRRWRISSVISLIRIIIMVVRLRDLDGFWVPPLVDHVALHTHLQRPGHDAHTSWADRFSSLRQP